MLSKKVHVVAHTHWDREWYFSTSDSLVLLDNVVGDVIKELQENPNANFCLDGQLSIVEDYLRINPQQYEVIKKLVDENRLSVGPWFTQTDTKLVSGNSIVNNMYYGIYKSNQLFSKYMKIGYLPDTFGFSNQVPMILKQFDLHNAIIWRGKDIGSSGCDPYFNWIGQDQSSVQTALLYGGYGVAKGFNTSKTFIEGYLNPYLDIMSTLSKTDDILLPVGNDQTNIIKDLDEKIKASRYPLNISTYEKFMDKISTTSKESIEGEFNEVVDTRVHKTSGAIRSDIKQSNYQAEISLTKALEPLNVMANFENMGISNYLIYDAWKNLFEGQAHDGIVGCVSDSVRDDIMNRNKQALEIALSSQNLLKKRFAQKMQLNENEILIFNLDVKQFEGYKELEVLSSHQMIELQGVRSQSILETTLCKGKESALVEKPEGNFYEEEQDYYLHKILVEVSLPSFGYKAFTIVESKKEIQTIQHETIIQNEHYRIFYQDECITLSYNNKEIKDFISLYDSGNAGDTYDYSPPEKDWEMKLKLSKVFVKKDEHVEIMEVDCSTILPYDLQERAVGTTSVECHGKLQISLRKDDMIYITFTFENKVLNHRLRLKVSGNNRDANQSYAATPYGSIKRDIVEAIIDDWQSEYLEKPVDVETNSGFVSFVGKGKQLVVFNKGVKEYQVQDGAIFMSILSSTDSLGKSDLLYRPGRASGDITKKGHIEIKTEKAQVLYTHQYEFAISFVENDDTMLYSLLDRFEMPSVFYQNQKLNLFYERIDNKIQLQDVKTTIEKEKSYLSFEGDFACTSVYTSLLDQQFKLRVISYHTIDKNAITSSFSFKVGNLLEEGNETELKQYRLYTIRGDL